MYPRDFPCHLVGGIYDHAQTHCLTAKDQEETVCVDWIKVLNTSNLIREEINKRHMNQITPPSHWLQLLTRIRILRNIRAVVFRVWNWPNLSILHYLYSIWIKFWNLLKIFIRCTLLEMTKKCPPPSLIR